MNRSRNYSVQTAVGNILTEILTLLQQHCRNLFRWSTVGRLLYVYVFDRTLPFLTPVAIASISISTYASIEQYQALYIQSTFKRETPVSNNSHLLTCTYRTGRSDTSFLSWKECPSRLVHTHCMTSFYSKLQHI